MNGYYLIVDFDKLLSDFGSLRDFQMKMLQLVRELGGFHKLGVTFYICDIAEKISGSYADYLGASVAQTILPEKIKAKLLRNRVIFSEGYMCEIRPYLPEHLKVIEVFPR